MTRQFPEVGAAGVAILLFLLAVTLFASPLTGWWLSFTPPWWTPWLIWAGLLALAGLTIGRRTRRDL